jgi:bacterial/archaeal transporter family-2 protein
VSGGNAVAAILSASAGLAAAVQVAIFGRFGDRVGTLPAFAFSCVITAVIAAVILVVGQRTVGGFAAAWHAPKWLWIGGVLGAFIVLSITIAAPRIGTFATVALIIAGQLTISTVIDRFGLFGFKQVPFTPYRVAGIILLTVGALLALKR